MRIEKADIKLKERVKELRCLYQLSKIAWEADNDLQTLVRRTLEILPAAMQHPELAEACISIDTLSSATPGFPKCTRRLSLSVMVGKKKRGQVTIGYRPPKKAQPEVSFLKEERHLVAAVAREFSLYTKRASTEDEKKRLEAQLQHAERLAFVGELSAGIAHELNEPLGRILGFAQLIRKEGGLNTQQHDDIERIVKASLYTREIIKKLMIFSRQMPQQITSVNLNDIVANILYFIDARFVSRQIKMTRRLAEKLPPIQADEVQIGQILVNLITNAIHAMPHGGELSITTRVKGRHAALSVKDTGEGMSSEVRRKMFEPFFTTKAVGQGTGLGLSVVQGIVIAHKGKIEVSSKPGKGTTVEVLLPLRNVEKERRK